MSLPKLVEALSRREGHVEVAEWLVQLAYRPRDEGPRADPRRLTDVHGTGQAHTAHPDRKSGLLNSDPPPWAVASDPRATHEGVERLLHQAVVLARGVLGHRRRHSAKEEGERGVAAEAEEHLGELLRSVDRSGVVQRHDARERLQRLADALDEFVTAPRLVPEVRPEHANTAKDAVCGVRRALDIRVVAHRVERARVGGPHAPLGLVALDATPELSKVVALEHRLESRPRRVRDVGVV